MVDDVSGESIQPGVVALVPMRHVSLRVPEKNYRELAGRPLYAHILETLQQCPGIKRIVVDTDSPIISQGIESAFPEIEIIDRPEEIWGPDVSMNEVLAHDVAEVPAPFYLQTHSTNPLLKAQTISAAIARFFAEYPEHDSLFSVTPIQARLWDEQGKPINHDPNLLLNTQNLPPIFIENSCLYIFGRKQILGSGNRIGNHPFMFEINMDEAHDIDTEQDFRIAESWIMAR